MGTVMRHHDPVHSVNLGLGLVLLALAIIFFFTGGLKPLDLIVLGVSALLSVYAGVTKNERISYVINLALGIYFITSAAALSWIEYTVLALLPTLPVYDMSFTDIIRNSLLALCFII